MLKGTKKCKCLIDIQMKIIKLQCSIGFQTSAKQKRCVITKLGIWLKTFLFKEDTIYGQINE